MDSTSFLSLYACPVCAGALETGAGDTLRCAQCGARYGYEANILDLRRAPEAGAAAGAARGPAETTETVRAFYTESPFPNYPPEETIFSLRSRASRSEFARLLDQAIPGDASVVEIGCGTGQMSLFLATAERRVVGADLTRASLNLAADAARRFGVQRARFVETDLRNPGLRDGAFDVVYSSGVLHHTPNPAASFARVARLLRPGGVMVLGLYNQYARLPHRVRRGLSALTGFRWVPFDPVLRARDSEPERKKAWFRDQYLHPEEHRHSIAEVQRWFAAAGIRYLRCFPDSRIAAEPLEGPALFSAADDNWGLENVISQLGWGFTLGHEGGLWVTIGVKD